MKLLSYLKESTNYKGPKGKLWKFQLVFAFILLGLILSIIRLFNIQVLNSEKYVNLAKRQHESKIDLRAERGNILDRNGNLLATTFSSLSVAVDPTLLENKDKICDIIAKNLDISKSKLLNKIRKSNGSFVWLVRGELPNRLSELRGIKDKGLILIEEPKRNFPYRKTASQIVGFTNIDNKGISGIELGWDSLLIGRSGFMLMYRDGLGRLRPSPELPFIEPIHGNSIELTIDVELQQIVEYELAKGIERTLAEAATVIAIKPQTGEILAMASYPFFDPYNITKQSSAGMRLRGITDVYEPGSTFKMITAAAALEEKLVSEDEIFDGHNGVLSIRGGVIRDVHAMGKVDFRTAMVNSSNIILSEVANRLPSNKLYSYIRNFGFGLKTEIDLPGEVSGKLPKPENFHANTKRYLGHGYGLSVNALQLVNSYAAVANGGKLMKPFLVKKVYNSNGDILHENKPQQIRQVISESTCIKLTDLLVSVVDSGSGKAARIDGLRIAGKTGTSQQLVDGRYSKSDYHASFAGFLPAENPKIALVVIVDRPRRSIYGGYNAAPIFRNISARWMSANDYSDKVLISKNENSEKDSVLMPNLIGLQGEIANKILDEIGIDYDKVNESHFVYNQLPKAGDYVPKYEKVIVTSGEFQNNDEENQDRRHDVIGFKLNKALNLLHQAGVYVKVVGKGRVYKQEWDEKDGQVICTLYSK